MPHEIEQLKKLLDMAQAVMRGAILAIAENSQIKIGHSWREMQEVCNMLASPETEELLNEIKRKLRAIKLGEER